ncbi:MAG: HD domain-containing protein [Alphaproteobacteria bacterium]|nr:HD domain-containing protein [Alphaproteobacteria bacterium]
MTTPALQIVKALNFAAQKHTDQRRKGERAEPYVNHLTEVAELLATHTGGTNTDVILAGILHDTVEDTKTTRDELVREFGENIADIVMECTDDKSLPKAERKRLQVENAPHKSDDAKMVKMADKISNLRAILLSPPPDWELSRKQEYFDWAKKVVDGCRGVNAGLEKEFDKTYARGVKTFGMKAA